MLAAATQSLIQIFLTRITATNGLQWDLVISFATSTCRKIKNIDEKLNTNDEQKIEIWQSICTKK